MPEAPRGGGIRLAAQVSLGFLSAALALSSCAPKPPPVDPRLLRARAALAAARMPEAAKTEAAARLEAEPAAFLAALEAVLAVEAADPERFRRVDRVAPPLPAEWAPSDLEPLDGSGLLLNKSGMSLRRGALAALRALAESARASGIRLEIASAYRSYAYQEAVRERSLKLDGPEATERLVAAPGRSQHQLGTAVDFSPVDAAFADTAASDWLSANAGRLGWSLSYPAGREAETGYSPEAWHWRWLGPEATAFAATWFGGAQDRLLIFLEAWRKAGETGT